MTVVTESLAIPEVKLVRPKKHGDARGFFSETYVKKDFVAAGIDVEFIQDNHSFSADVGTVRGLHFQTAPFAQDKLVRVTRGAVIDVAVDIRLGSPTFGKHVAVRLSAQEWNQLFVPKGFAHGFVTIEPDTEFLYKVSAPYAPEHDKGLLWNDPALGIDWGISSSAATLSARDKVHPTLADLPAYFQYGKGSA